MKSRISAMDVITWCCIINTSLIFISITIMSFKGKHINGLAVESVATVVCLALLILSAITLHKYKKKQKIKDAEENLQQSKKLEEHSQYFDFTSNAICCGMQVFMLCEQIFLNFFATHPSAVMFRKVIDLLGTGFACAATIMILTSHGKQYLHDKQQDDKQQESTSQKNNPSIIPKRQIVVLSLLLCCGLMNFCGKAMASFMQSSNIHLKAHSDLRIGILLRGVGIGLLAVILIANTLISPKQRLQQSQEAEPAKKSPKAQTSLAQ